MPVQTAETDAKAVRNLAPLDTFEFKGCWFVLERIEWPNAYRAQIYGYNELTGEDLSYRVRAGVIVDVRRD
jgi:hypothetical protein